MTRGSPTVRWSRGLICAPQAQGQRIEPPVAEHHAERVGPALQLVRHVVGRVEHAFRVGGPAGVQHLVSDALAVQPQLVIAQPADIDPGAADLLLERELLPEQRRRVVLEHLLLRAGSLPLARDPGGAPIRSAPATPSPTRPPRCRPRAALAVPGAHLPIDPLARTQRLAAIDHVDRLRRMPPCRCPTGRRCLGPRCRDCSPRGPGKPSAAGRAPWNPAANSGAAGGVSRPSGLLRYSHLRPLTLRLPAPLAGVARISEAARAMVAGYQVIALPRVARGREACKVPEPLARTVGILPGRRGQGSPAACCRLEVRGLLRRGFEGVSKGSRRAFEGNMENLGFLSPLARRRTDRLRLTLVPDQCRPK